MYRALRARSGYGDRLMNSALLVACGGALGALARYKLSTWIVSGSSGQQFPLATFVVNVVGCLFAGLLIGGAERFGEISPQLRLLVFTGILGGFTTFSAFGVETIALIKDGAWNVALLYATLSVLVGCGAVAAGFWVAKS